MDSLLRGLVVHWPLEESSGIRGSHNGLHNLTDNNTVDQATGHHGVGAALFATANSEYLSVADAGSILSVGGTIDWTIAFWVYFTSKSADMEIISRHVSGTGEFSCRYAIATDSFRFYVLDAAQVDTNIIGFTPNTATWYLVKIFRDVANNIIGLQVLNDGTRLTTAFSGSTAIATSTGEVDLGRLPIGNNRFLDGRLQGVSLWRRQLTVQEDAALWNDGVGLAWPFGGPLRSRMTRARRGLMTPLINQRRPFMARGGVA